MADYLRAECYKLTHRSYLWLALLITGALELLLVVLFAALNGDITNMTASVGFTMLLYLLPIGYYATAITGDIVFSEQYRHNTLKNEVAYGLSRLRIYFGKLLTSCLLALAACAVIVLWYGLLCAVLLPGDGAMLRALQTVGLGLLAALPVWLGAQALFIMCFFVFRGSTAATLVGAGILAILGQALDFLYLLVSFRAPALGEIVLVLQDLLLTAPLEGLIDDIGNWSRVGWAWAVGLGWFAATTAIGCWSFHKREIS